MNLTSWKLQWFTEAPAAPAAPAESGAAEATGGGDIAGTGAAEMTTTLPEAGTVLPDGTRVDARLAAALKKQAERHPETAQKIARAQAMPRGQQTPQPQPEQQPAEKGIEEEWNELKKGKFRDLYGADVKNAITERFKNQTDANAQLEQMKPMLDVLMKKAGVQTVEELSNYVLDDDSLYEEDAEAHGMTVSAYKEFLRLQKENEEARARQEQFDRDQFMRQHLSKLATQADEMKTRFPDFNLDRELENDAFRRMVAPNVGMSVEQAYFAVHHDELMPQAISYGMQQARSRISRDLQANARRPVEGAMTGGQPADNVGIDPKKMSREEREQLILENRRLKAAGGRGITFD